MVFGHKDLHKSPRSLLSSALCNSSMNPIDSQFKMVASKWVSQTIFSPLFHSYHPGPPIIIGINYYRWPWLCSLLPPVIHCPFSLNSLRDFVSPLLCHPPAYCPDCFPIQHPNRAGLFPLEWLSKNTPHDKKFNTHIHYLHLYPSVIKFLQNCESFKWC